MSLDRKFLEAQMLYEKKIAEKDKAIENWEIMYKSVVQTCSNNAKEIKRLKDQLALTEKALELACKWINDIQEMDGDCPIYADCFRVEKDCDNWDCGNCDCSKFAIEHFKTKAKEIIKSE